MSKMSGFSTLNRWLGKKNKDKSLPNGKLSKSSQNLSMSVSTTDMSEPSQLEYNRITPVPVATSNEPFEQNFRITVLLPKDQLYVARLGARITLTKLLELVCENKLLDAQKYEFRNPVDPSQVYNNELTIGAVGLSEVRLCHKSESYDNFNTDEVIKLHRTSVIRDSLSSSEFSSRNSKHTTKTASPYSSSNSLNSMDSTGVNYIRTPVTQPALPASSPPKMMAPPRKKRAAPRPPSQTAIPEKSALVLPSDGKRNGDSSTLLAATPTTPIERKDYYVSTPNLALQATLHTDTVPPIDCNGNTKSNGVTNGNYDEHDDSTVEAEVGQKNARNLYGGSVQNLSTIQTQVYPEPSPRKRLLNIKKKSAPAPPPGMRYSLYSEDSVSLASNSSAPSTPQTPVTPLTPQTPQIPLLSQQPLPAIPNNSTPTSPAAVSINEAPTPIKPMPREATSNNNTSLPPQSSTPVDDNKPLAQSPAPVQPQSPAVLQQQQFPKPVPRSTTTTLLNATPPTAAAATRTPSPKPERSALRVAQSPSSSPTSLTHNNVSKVMLNRTPTPEPRSLSTEPPLDIMLDSALGSRNTTHLNEHDHDNDDNVSKQADSGIGEPVPSPLPDSLPSEGSANECKSTFESSSDDDDMVKVYNFKLGKTVIKPLRESKTLEDLSAIAGSQSDSGEPTPAIQADLVTPMKSEATLWNFAIPISPPPNFADANKLAEHQEEASDAPITPKIMERPMLNFETLTAESKPATPEPKEEKKAPKPAALDIPNNEHVRATTPLASPTGPLNEILDELTTIISEKRMDTIIRKADDQPQIEAAKPNTLTNFSITASQQSTTKPLEIQDNNEVNGSTITPPTTPEEERIYRKRDSPTNSTTILSQRKSVARSDSFHTTVTQQLQSISNISQGSDENGTNGMTSRSSSYLSLTKIEQNGLNLNRRRSSSELSIGESPSLQSLEVIKTILNSRKNSLANSSDGETKAVVTELINKIEDPKIAESVVEISKVPEKKEEPKKVVEQQLPNVETAVEPKTNPTKQTLEQQPSVEEEVQQRVSKELPKVYRYSGPPSINFSTWSERPKVQVAIKNEGDYIFGGKNAPTTPSAAAMTTSSFDIETVNTNSIPRNYRTSTPASSYWSEKQKNKNSKAPPPILPPKPDSTTQRMGIPDKEFRVPITVQPLKDAIVEPPQVVTVEPMGENKTQQTTDTTKTSRASIATVILNCNDAKVASVEATTITVLRRPITHASYSNATLPRVGSTANRFSTPVVIATPTTLRATNISTLERPKPSNTVNNTISSNSTSSNTNVATTVETVTAAAPFGQNTLRKTGFKEKMLAKEEAAQQKAKMGVASVSINAAAPHPHVNVTTITPLTNGNTYGNTNGTTKVTITSNRTSVNATSHKPEVLPKTTTTLHSAKLEMKLQQKPDNIGNTVLLNQPTVVKTSTNSFISKPPTSPKITTTIIPAAPAPPPAPPMTLSVGAKAGGGGGKKGVSKSAGTTPTSPLDTRDQLMAAIRNFKRDNMRHT